jgi:hypothetical protein
MEYLGAWGTLTHEKNQKSKISCQTPFKYGVRSPKFILTPVYSCTHCLPPWLKLPPSPAFGLIYEGAIGQPR